MSAPNQVTTTPDTQARARLRRKAEAAKELAPGHWHLAQNRHPTTDGRPWGAMELRVHPAGGAGKRLFAWTGTEQRTLADFIADTDPTTIIALLDRLDAAEELLAEAWLNIDWTPETNPWVVDWNEKVAATLPTHEEGDGGRCGCQYVARTGVRVCALEPEHQGFHTDGVWYWHTTQASGPFSPMPEPVAEEGDAT